MDPLELKTEQIATYIIRVLELYYQQGVSTTWRDIFTFLKIPEVVWKDDPDIDDPIIINSESELVIMKAMISSRFATRH